MATAADIVAASWSGRNIWAVVDLDALTTNVQAIADHVGESVRVMAVVKANGYGHGAVPVARAALAGGATELAVATVDEGAQLRNAGITEPVLALSAIGRHERPRAAALGLGIIVTNRDFAHALAADAKAALVKDPVSIHLKIDSGMNRFGAEPDEALTVAQAIASHSNLRLDGVMTHFACADAEFRSFTDAQAARLDDCLAQLANAEIPVPTVHIANSAATLRFPEYHRNMVRLGIAMYGLVPDRSIPLLPGMKPALTIHGRLIRVHTLESGEAVGYGATHTVTAPESVGLVTMGYADGYRRSLSNRAWASIRGQRADVVGRVSMDQLVLRIPDGLEVGSGEPVTLVGNGTGDTSPAPTLDDLADIAGTIGYELATGLAPRVPRVYVAGGQVVGIADLAGYREL